MPMNWKTEFWRCHSMKSPADETFPISSDGGAHDDELVGIRIGQRSEQRGVHDAEDGGVGADAQSQCENGDGCEAGILYKLAESKTGVTQQVDHARALPIKKLDEARPPATPHWHRRLYDN